MSQIFIARHWVFTLLCGPIFFAIVNGFNANWRSNDFFDFFQLYPFMILMGLLFSLPTYIILFTVFRNIKLQTIYAKTILIITVVIGIFITTALINGTVWLDLALFYSISSIIVGLFFSLYFKNETES
jgi:Sec-independent protein secretion pathway component TatC